MRVRPGYLGCSIGRLRLGLSERLEGGEIELVEPIDICVLTEQIMTVSESVRRELYVYIFDGGVAVLDDAYPPCICGGPKRRAAWTNFFSDHIRCLSINYIYNDKCASIDRVRL